MFTFNSECCASQLVRAYKLLLHVPLEVDKHTWQVPLREVRYAGLCYRLQELSVRELSCKLSEVLVQQGTLLDAGMAKWMHIYLK